MGDLVDAIREKLDGDFLAEAFPVLNKHGLRDEDVFVHSIGCSIWNTLGHELGYTAIVEGPAPVASGNDIRSDSVWFDKSSNTPIVLIEFERYDGTDRGRAKLVEKLTNLMEAAMRWGNQPKLLVLSAWSPGLVSAPDFTYLENLFVSGRRNSKGTYIPKPAGCNLLLHRMVFEQEVDRKLRIKHMSYRPLDKGCL